MSRSDTFRDQFRYQNRTSTVQLGFMRLSISSANEALVELNRAQAIALTRQLGRHFGLAISDNNNNENDNYESL